MTLITRQGKGSKLTIQEMDGNLEYLDSLGKGQKLLEDADALARTEFPDNYLLDDNADLQAGVFKSSFNVPDIFNTILSGDPNDVSKWNNGPVLQEVEGVFIGNKLSEDLPNGDSFGFISGFSLPVQQDLPVFGNVNIFTADERVTEDRLSSSLKSPFVNIAYSYEIYPDTGEYLHQFYINVGAFATAMIEVEGDATVLSNVDLRFL